MAMDGEPADMDLFHVRAARAAGDQEKTWISPSLVAEQPLGWLAGRRLCTELLSGLEKMRNGVIAGRRRVERAAQK